MFIVLNINVSFQTCSRGTACNFIHCFRNPGGDYEWADLDKPPPKYWVRKMAALFGTEESGYDNLVQQGRNSNKMMTADTDRCTCTIKIRCELVKKNIYV